MKCRPRPRHSRRGVVAIWFELLLGGVQIGATGGGAWLLVSGHQEWREAQKQAAAAGYVFDIEELARGPVPNTENFGATPALKGTGAPAEEQTPEIKATGFILPPNKALMVTTFLGQARYLEKSDWAGLMGFKERWEKSMEQVIPFLAFRTSLARSHHLGFGTLSTRFAQHEFRRRLVIAACALERRRLSGQQLPDTLEDLPKRLLPAVPLDVDGQPIRYRPTPEGFVLWSVGLDLKDDWKGAPPPENMKDPEKAKQPDWQLRVP